MYGFLTDNNLPCSFVCSSTRNWLPINSVPFCSVCYFRNSFYVGRKPPPQIFDAHCNKTPIGSRPDFVPSSESKTYLPEYSDDYNYDGQAWVNKRIESWSVLDTKNWLYLASQEIGQLYREISPKLAVPGEELLLLSRRDFAVIDQHFGDKLYDLLQERANSERSISANSENPYPLKKVSDIKLEPLSDEETIRGSECPSSDEEPVVEARPIKERPERTRRTNPRKKTDVRTAGLKIWEFIRNLLLDPKYCPKWIRWENYEEKSFRFMETKKIAQLWGARNNNKKMNYSDFSRAMRYHYRKKRLAVVRPPHKLVYKFGPEATGLETDNPNFEYIITTERGEFPSSQSITEITSNSVLT